MYHLVFPTKYRSVVIDKKVDEVIKTTCEEIEKRYEIHFMEIGTDKDHIHLLIQSVPTYDVTKLVRIIKSITAREVFKQCPEVKQKLWGGSFWTSGYLVGTVGKHGNEETISNYVKDQGETYIQLHKSYQIVLF